MTKAEVTVLHAAAEMASKLVGKSLDVVSGLKSETNVSSDSISVVESNPAEKTCGVTSGGIQFGSFDDEAERETPFNYMIRVPRDDDERLEVKIRLAQTKVDEKIRIRYMLHIDMQSTRVTCEEYRNEFSYAVFQERLARDLHRSKCLEIELLQSVIDIEDIDVKIRNLEWTIKNQSYQTIPLKVEKLSSIMSRHDENQQGLDRKERLKSLKKEADQLKANLINAVAITEVIKRKYYDESEKISKLLYLLNAADDNQQEAYEQLQSLKKQLYEKEEEAAKLKEQRQLEEIAKAKEALERKRQKAEKAEAREANRAVKEAEKKEKKREKRVKKKENQKAVATAGDTGIEDESACPTSETLAETSKETENNEKPVVATTERPQKVSKFVKQTKVTSIPPPIRNRGKQKLRP